LESFAEIHEMASSSDAYQKKKAAELLAEGFGRLDDKKLLGRICMDSLRMIKATYDGVQHVL